MIKGFETENEDRAEAAFILYAVLKSRPDNSPINQLHQMFIDWGAVRRYVKKIFKKSETIADFVEKFSQAIGVEEIQKQYIKDIDFENDKLLKCLNDNTLSVIALLQIRFSQDSKDFKEKYNNDEE